MKTYTHKVACPNDPVGRAWVKHAVFGFCLVFLFLSINKVYADVYINEVAWMGTTVSSTNEWIELYNDGPNDVDLEGWVLTAEDGSPNITINGAANSVIGTNKYYLIERTDDATVPDVIADFVAAFGNGLSNTGEKLFLKKSDGTIVETLDYKSGWPSGDNVTKQTMQRVGSSWVTSVPTPRAVNAGASTVPSTVNTGGSFTVTNTNTNTDTIKKEVVPPKPKISIITNKSTVTNVATSFDALYTGTNSSPIVFGYFVWSMGDGTNYNFSQQKKFMHTYQYAGDYNVNVAYFYNSWNEDPVIETNIIVHVENAGVSVISLGSDGTVIVKNNSDQDILLSKWLLYEGSKSYTFPYGMAVLANKSITIPARITGFDGSQMPTLYYPNGIVYGSTPTIATVVPPAVQNSKTTKHNIVNEYVTNSVVNSSVIENIEPNIALTANVHDVVNLSTQTKNTRWWVFVVLGIIVCGLGYLAMNLYRSKPEAVQEEFHLLDE